MKKPKISLDKDKLQQFFLQHIEKILLVIVVGLMFLLIYRGFSLPHIDNTLSPQGLISQTGTAKQYIDDPNRWSEVSPTRPVDYNIVAGVRAVQKQSDPLAYMLITTWSRPDFPKLSPRQDPELFPPQHLIVRPVMGVLASYPKTEDEWNDPLFPQMSDEELKNLRAKIKREEAKKKKAAASDLGGEMPGGEGGAPARRTKKGKAAAGGEGGEMAGPGGGMPGGMGGAYGGGMMAGDRYPESLTIGFIPQSPEQTIRRIFPSVTIMAVVPIQKQTEEYEKKLANSLDYSPQRDIPFYMEFRVQRADVTEIDPATAADKLPWQNLANPVRLLAELYGDQTTGAVGLYAGIPMEVSDPSYLSEALTHPAPPYLQRDLWDLLTHPDVPLASFNSGYGEGMPGATGPAAGGADPGDDAPSAPLMGPAGMRGGMGGMPGGGEGGMPGGGMMRPGFGRAGGGEGGMMPGGGMPGGGMMGGMRPGGGMPGGGMPGGGMMGGMRPGGMGMPGGGEGGMGYGGGMQTYTPPKHQLIRFTDKDVVPGHKYRYRFRVTVYDPNHPDLSMPPPSAASLHEDVRKRLKQQDDEDATKPKSQQTGLAYRTYWRFTPWSDASPIAVVPRGERVFAGKVTPRAPTKVKGIDVASEPMATALAMVFDQAKKADVPAEMSGAGRGYVLNFSLDPKDPKDKPKVIHPVTKEVVELTEKYNVTTNALVADLMGGDLIKPIVTGSAAQTLSGLGEMLIVDADGRIHVQNEGDDILQFRRFTVPKPDPKAAKAPTDAAGGLEGAMPGPVGRRPTN